MRALLSAAVVLSLACESMPEVRAEDGRAGTMAELTDYYSCIDARCRGRDCPSCGERPALLPTTYKSRQEECEARCTTRCGNDLYATPECVSRCMSDGRVRPGC